jgi:hypothetical protein
MKNLLLLSLFTIAFASLKAQTADEMAIQKLCETETRSWLNADAVTFNNCWQLRPYSRIMVTTEDGQTISIGSSQMQSAVASQMGGGGTFANSNYQIHIEGNTAWATYDEVKTDAKGQQHPSYELRLLEKVNGEWKIVGMSVHHYQSK